MGQGKFHTETTNTLDYVVRQADSVMKSLTNVSNYLTAAKNVGVAQFFLPANIKQSIDHVDKSINASSTILQRGTGENAERIQHVLDSASVNLFVNFLLFKKIYMYIFIVTFHCFKVKHSYSY